MPEHLTTAASARHHHQVAFYDSDAFLVETVADAVLSALASGSVAAAVVTPAHGEAIEQALEAAGLDVASARARGDYRAFDAESALADLMVDGEVDEATFDGLAAGVFEVAADRNCEVTICGELAPLLWRTGDVSGAMRVEDLCNLLPAWPPYHLTCLYPMEAFDDEHGLDPFVDLCDQHVEVVPDEHYTRLRDPSDQRRAVALLQRQERAVARERERLQAQRGELEAALARFEHDANARQEQFDEAIESRDLIGQAKGILMNRCHVDADTAFAMLREASNRSNRKLRDVASSVVAQQRHQDRHDPARPRTTRSSAR